MSEKQEDRVELAKKLKDKGIDPRLAAVGAVRDESASAPWLDVPVVDVELPSKGRVYPVESSLHNKESIEIRAMTAKEEDILTSSSLLRQGKAMSALIKNCVMDKSIDPDELLIGDRNAILIAIRMSGYGSEYETTLECGECGETYEKTFEIDKIAKTKSIGADPDHEGVNEFTFQLPMSKKTAKIKLMTGLDDKSFTQSVEKERKVKGPGSVESNITLKLFHHVISLDGMTDGSKLKRTIEMLPARDSLALRRYIDKISPGLDMLVSAECPTCGRESEVEMPIGHDFFWPDAGR